MNRGATVVQDSNPQSKPEVIAIRKHPSDSSRLERLCLTHGNTARYRIYLSVNDNLAERSDDLEACEFDSTDDIGLSRFLIESLWRLNVTPSSLVEHLSALDSR